MKGMEYAAEVTRLRSAEKRPDLVQSGSALDLIASKQIYRYELSPAMCADTFTQHIHARESFRRWYLE